MVKVPYFRQRLRGRLLEHPYWRRRSYQAAFFCTATFAGALSVLLAMLVLKPEFARRMHVAMTGEGAGVEYVASPDRAPEETPAAPTLVAVTAPDLSTLSAVDAAALASNNGGVPEGAVRLPDGLGQQELEIVKRLAAAALEKRGIDARPVGSIQLREYELNNGQRMMVVDEVRPAAGTVKCVYH